MSLARENRTITRADVARYAGVSTAVVSYVVNGGPRPVAPTTAAKVRDAMRVLRYQPNLNARALKRGTSQTLGLVLLDSLNPFFAELSLAVESEAAARGQRMLVATSHGDRDLEDQLVAELLGRQVDGLLLVSSFRRSDPSSSLPLGETPTVLLDCSAPVPGWHTIGPNSLAGAITAVDHLIHQHSCRTVGLITGLDEFATPDPREAGWESALRHAGLPLGPVAVTNWFADGGYRAARTLLSCSTPPDAIFVTSDAQAVGVLHALNEAGVDVARECPVVSFDGTSSSSWTWPSLTSARQPVEAMAAKALDLVHSPGKPPAHHMFDIDLIIRASCGCLPGAA